MSDNTAKTLETMLIAKAVTKDIDLLRGFFKTNASDVFIGVRVPEIRIICKQCNDLSLSEIQKVLNSPVHECRLAAVILLADQYKKSTTDKSRQAIYDLYIKNVHDGRVNNWDLVDSSAEFIVGPWLQSRSKDVLFQLAADGNLWARRVSILAAFDYVKSGNGATTLALAERLLNDKEDLIQKAVGWQLREVGKRVDRQLLLGFLDEHAAQMPRTTLRYAIEHLPPEQKVHYMSRKPTDKAKS